MWSGVGHLQEALELIFIRLIKCEEDFGGQCGGGREAFPGGQGQYYECQDKRKASFRHSVMKRRLVSLKILGKLHK